MKLATVGDGVAECGYSRVIPRAAPLAVQVREAVDQRLRPGALLIIEKQLLPRQLALAVGAVGIASLKGSLNAAREHHWALVAVVLKQAEQRLAKPHVALHELGRVLGAIDARKVKHEVSGRTVEAQFLLRVVAIVLIDSQREKVLILLPAVFAVGYVLQRFAQVSPYESLCAGDQHLHYCTASYSRPSSASCTYSAVLIFSTVPAMSRRRVL